MAWLPHGESDAGFLLAPGQARSRTEPAVSVHRGRLWVLWSDVDGSGAAWYAVEGDSGAFGPRRAFPQSGLPVTANLNGLLHALVVSEPSGEMVHYQFDDEETHDWECLGPLGGGGGGIVSHSTPGLVAFHNKLFLVFLRDGRLYYAVWNVFDRQWTAPAAVIVVDDTTTTTTTPGRGFRGIPALFVLDGALHVLCAADTEEREILGYRFDYIASAWTACDDVSEGRAASGVSATSYGDSAYLGFIGGGGEDDAHAVFVASYAGSAWSPHEAVADARAADPPQIAILNGRIHCIFSDDTPSRDLRWYSRPVLSYSLSTWMGGLPDEAAVSDLTIPGTHDSCARSNIPFVRTQYLSITQQLRLGIRFLDLRLRAHDDGVLYCYHGGIPIDLPTMLPFASVMAEVWAFLEQAGRTETVLISINNDDTSEEQKADPGPFYRAVASAIATAPTLPDGRPRWDTSSGALPALGAVRGQALLLRRYRAPPTAALPPSSSASLSSPSSSSSHPIGLDLSAWEDDNPHFTITTASDVTVRLQDKWKYADRVALHDLVESKQGYVRTLLRAAASAPPETVFVNFCSAVGDPVEHGEVAEAKWIAVGAHSNLIGKWVTGMNRLTRDFLTEQEAEKGVAGLLSGAAAAVWGKRRRRYGIVNLDYPELPEDNDLVARLIETNF